jgi:hypothetical protein
MPAWFSGSFNDERPISGFLDIPSCRLAPVFEANDQQPKSLLWPLARGGASAAITKCQFLAQVTNLQAFANAS